MRRPRTAGMFVGLLALPVALLGALPAVAWHLSDGLPFGLHDATLGRRARSSSTGATR